MAQIVNASVKISQDLHSRIKNLAEVRHRTAHAIMLQAIESYVGREEKRERLRIEAREAHEEYMRTGLHLNNEEVVDWMEKIILGEKVAMPKCHI